MNDQLEQRLLHLVNQLEAWRDGEGVTLPHYVAKPLEDVRAMLDEPTPMPPCSDPPAPTGKTVKLSDLKAQTFPAESKSGGDRG